MNFNVNGDNKFANDVKRCINSLNLNVDRDSMKVIGSDVNKLNTTLDSLINATTSSNFEVELVGDIVSDFIKEYTDIVNKYSNNSIVMIDVDTKDLIVSKLYYEFNKKHNSYDHYRYKFLNKELEDLDSVRDCILMILYKYIKAYSFLLNFAFLNNKLYEFLMLLKSDYNGYLLLEDYFTKWVEDVESPRFLGQSLESDINDIIALFFNDEPENTAQFAKVSYNDSNNNEHYFVYDLAINGLQKDYDYSIIIYINTLFSKIRYKIDEIVIKDFPNIKYKGFNKPVSLEFNDEFITNLELINSPFGAVRFKKLEDLQNYMNKEVFDKMIDENESESDEVEVKKDRLYKLFEIQDFYDNKGFKENNTNRESTKKDRLLWLISEIGELLQTDASFKYLKRKDKKNYSIEDKQEEWIDLLHLVLSIGIDIFKSNENEEIESIVNKVYDKFITKTNTNINREK